MCNAVISVCQECAERGEDYNRVKLLEISAEDAERWERKKKKRNPDPGFSGIKHSSQLHHEYYLAVLIDWLRERGNVAAMCDAKNVKMKTCRACVSRLVIIGSGNYYNFPSASPCKTPFPDPHSWICVFIHVCVCRVR